LAAPIPIGWLGGKFLGGPVMQLQTNQATTYTEALTQGLVLGWSGLIVVILLGAVLAWWTYRFQRDYHRSASGMWCAFVFLLGWPAFLAYWIEQRRPKLETCHECGTAVPRDREACPACRTVFPTPQRLGTEIFA
jgi:RNA polymerase subunit RPABC4/transcription elongation factor Spt4